MIKEIFVEGFRSLNPLELKLKDGLNVFVGANGSGKSNFISFLNFLHDITIQSIHHALKDAGGISRTFSRENDEGNQFRLRFNILGQTTNKGPSGIYRRILSEKVPTPTGYSYSCEIVFDLATGVLFVSKEHVRIQSEDCEDFGLLRQTDIGKDTKRHSIIVTPELHPYTTLMMRGSESLEELTALLESQITEDSTLLSQVSYRYPFLDIIRFELASLRLINIDPNQVRSTDSLTDYPIVEADGSGTIPTLYALSGNNQHRMHLHFHDGKAKLKSITSWAKEVLADLISLDVSLDTANLKYSAYASLRTGEESSRKFPFSTLSDGTLKWISIVTILFCSPGTVAIEEPENFLHPKMQRTLVELLNSSIERNAYGQFFVTTHSETFLDACSIDDLFIVEFFEGRTSISRPMNREEIKSRLQESQFGLGHYYKTGAIYAE